MALINSMDYFVIVSGLLILLISFFLDNFFYDYFRKSRDEDLGSKLAVFFHVVSSVILLGSAYAVLLLNVYMSRGMALTGEKMVIMLLAGTVAVLIFTYLVKVIVARGRPIAEQYIFFTRLKDYSFPSSHAAFAFGILALIQDEFVLTKAVWLNLALLVAVSRIYLERHYFSDVVAGAVLGYFIGMLVHQYQNVNFIIIASTIAFFAMLLIGKILKKHELNAEKQEKRIEKKFSSKSKSKLKSKKKEK